MAAQQAADIYEDAKVHVIPNKNIGTGYAALTAYDPDSDDIDGMLEAMSEAMGRVTAGCVSPSIRDTEMNGLNIAKGDTIGIIEKKIVLNNKDRAEASLALASMLLDDPEKTMLTVFAGVDTTDDDSDALISAISEKYPDADVFPIRGNQEVYPYIFVAE
jgi:dihydroxyacetone kinase-like predicted kinase